MPGTDPVRLAELIWRTIKLRVSLLILIDIVLLVVWSALLTGDQAAKRVDVALCSEMVAKQNEQNNEILRNSGFVGPVFSVSSNTLCAEGSARTYIESARMMNDAMFKPFLGSPDIDQQKIATIYNERKSELTAYDSQRRDAYKLQFQLSSTYSSSAITVNALSVAEVVPFVALLFLSIVVVLGFQQKQYRSEAATLIASSRESPTLAAAQAQFFVMPPRRGIEKWFTLSPEKVAIWSLVVATVLLIFSVLFAFVVNVIHLTESIFGNYLSYLLTATFVLGVALNITRRQYVSERTQTHVSTAARLWLEIVSVTMAFLALILPWTVGIGSTRPLRGYNFILFQKPSALFGMGILTQYPIEPRLFAQLRLRMDTAVLFIVVCVVQIVGRKRNWKWRSVIGAARALSACWVFISALNLILYMIVLEYESIRGTTWDFLTGMFNTIGQSGSGSRVYGFPLSFYDPSYGLFLFLLSSFILIWFSLGRYRDW